MPHLLREPIPLVNALDTYFWSSGRKLAVIQLFGKTPLAAVEWRRLRY